MTVAINGTGAVTGVSPVAMRSAGGSQTVTTGVTTKISLTTEIFDTSASFNNTGAAVGGTVSFGSSKFDAILIVRA